MGRPHALNMERLWAGDYSQLPAGQQLHALNLSAQQQQQAWLGQHQVNKVKLISYSKDNTIITFISHSRSMESMK